MYLSGYYYTTIHHHYTTKQISAVNTDQFHPPWPRQLNQGACFFNEVVTKHEQISCPFRVSMDEVS